MGLGKTIQTIALFAKLLESGIEGPHLVICPATVLNNWANGDIIKIHKIVLILAFILRVIKMVS